MASALRSSMRTIEPQAPEVWAGSPPRPTIASVSSRSGTRPASGQRMEPNTFDIIAMAKRVDARTKRKRVARILGGVAVATVGVLRGGGLAPLFVLSGAALLVRGVTDKPLKETAV